MRAYFVALFLLAVLIISETSAEKPRKHKKVRKHHKKTHTIEEPLESNPVASEEREVKENTDNNVFMDPCLRVRCGAGRVCEIDEVGEPQCVCIPTCPEQTEERRKVCTNHNETWTSDCAVYQHRCYCETGHKDCRGDEFRHIHIDYYGECKHMPDCTKEEMVDFPRRMRDWLYNIMRDLADRDELTPHYLQMEKEAETNMTRRWTNSAIWKFCDLDGNPPDKSVSRHELFPIRAPLMSLEHCIAPFLNSCDENNDHRINIQEWAKCLELDEDEIEDRCELINEEEE